MAFDWVSIVTSILAVLPAAAALLWGYSRYDGFFKDNVIFLYFVGGLVAGMGVAFFHAALVPYGLVFMVGIPFLEQLAKTIVLNRRKWQGEPHAVFNGGAYGAGMGIILSLFYFKRNLLGGWDWSMALQLCGVAIGITFLAITTGWVVGASVRDRKPFKGTLIASVAGIPMAYFLLYWLTPGEVRWVPVAMTAYGLGLLVYGIAKVLPGGLSAASLQELRRRKRKESRDAS